MSKLNSGPDSDYVNPPQEQYPDQAPGPQMSQTQMQPTAAMSPNIAGGNGPMPVQRERNWSHGLCDFFGSCGVCCFACWCPSMVYSKNKHRLDYLDKTGRADPEHGGSGCSGDCCMHASLQYLFAAGWILQIPQRQSIRRRYNISGGGCGDCCSAFLCTPCALTQESREMELEEQNFQKSY